MTRGLRSLAPFLSAMVIVLAACGRENPTQPANHAPIALAGTDRTVGVGGTALLIGSGIDEDPGDALTYVWTLVTGPAGSTAVIDNPGKPTASFVADSVGQYVARLTVSDGKSTGSDDVTITAIQVAAEPPPAPNAGGSKAIFSP